MDTKPEMRMRPHSFVFDSKASQSGILLGKKSTMSASGEEEEGAYLLRRKRTYNYSFENSDDDDTPQQPTMSIWHSRINKIKQKGPEAEEAFRARERERIQQQRTNMSEDKKDRNRELQRIRQYEYRQRQKAKAEEAVTRSEKEKNKQIALEKRQEKSAYMRAWRQKQPESTRIKYNEKRMTRYYKSKEQKTSKLPNDSSGMVPAGCDAAMSGGGASPMPADGATPMPVDSATLMPTAEGNSDFLTKDARRKAAARVRLPRDPEKFATTIAYTMEKASPRKKAALQRRDLLQPTTLFEENLRGHLATLTKDGSKAGRGERKRLVQALVQRSQHSILQMSKTLNLRWQFVKAASCLSIETEEIATAIHGNKTPAAIRKAVEDFYCQPEASIVVPDKRLVKKDLVPRACLTKSLKKFHQDFVKETGCRDVSFTTFKRLRPQHILTVKNLKRTSCVCKVCANVAQKLEALLPLCKAAGISLPANAQEMLDRTLCREVDRLTRLQCAQRKCANCGVATLLSVLQALPQDRIVSWFQWQLESLGSQKRMNNITKQGPVSCLVSCLEKELSSYGEHINTATWQYRQLRQLRQTLPADQILTLMDFAQNYRCEYQNEVQLAHWSYQQATVFPTVTYYRCSCGELTTESVVIIADNLPKDASTVHHFNTCVLRHLRDRRGLHITKQFQFTDGAGAQFKSKEPFVDISYASADHGIVVERSFFGSSHGKGPCDGVGGVVKAAATQAVLGKQAVIRTASEMFQHLCTTFSEDPDKECCHSRRVFLFVNENDICRERPGRRPRNAMPKTMQQHCVRSTGVPNVVEYRGLSCFCQICMTGASCPEMESFPQGRWQQYKFWPLVQPRSAPTRSRKPGSSRAATSPPNSTLSTPGLFPSAAPSDPTPPPCDAPIPAPPPCDAPIPAPPPCDAPIPAPPPCDAPIPAPPPCDAPVPPHSDAPTPAPPPSDDPTRPHPLLMIPPWPTSDDPTPPSEKGLYPGDFVKVQLGSSVFVAQVTRVSEEGLWGKYLEKVNGFPDGWKWPAEQVPEFFIQPSDILAVLRDYTTTTSKRAFVFIF